MSAYLTSVITVSALVSLALAVSYREGGGAERTALLVLLLYVSTVPLVNAVRDIDIGELSFEVSAPETGESAVDGVAREAFENGIRLFIAEEYSLDTADISVSTEGFDPSSVSAERILVTLSGDARYADYRGIRQSVEKNGLGRCEVKIAI